MRKNVKTRFMEKVSSTNPSQCWTWIAGKNLTGYGQFWYKNKQVGAHRVSWILFRGPIPKGKYVLHSCDNPSCVNPFHLFIGTAQDNTLDMLKKGRGDPKANLPKDAKGENNGRARITREDARRVKNLWKSGKFSTKTALAKHLGISRPTVVAIVLGKTWKNA
jgi:hypothetical protein